MKKTNRREFVATTAAAGATVFALSHAFALPVEAFNQAAASSNQANREIVPAEAVPFPMKNVRLGPGPFNVAGGLHHALSFYNAKALVGIAALALRRFQYGPARLFYLKKQRIIIGGEKERDIAARSDTAHSHNFNRAVLPLVTINQFAAIPLQRFFVLFPERPLLLLEFSIEFLKMEDYWRIVFDLPVPIHNRRELGKYRLRGRRASSFLFCLRRSVKC